LATNVEFVIVKSPTAWIPLPEFPLQFPTKVEFVTEIAAEDSMR